jgi:hypothetical protein
LKKKITVLITAGKNAGDSRVFRQLPSGEDLWGGVNFVSDASNLSHVDWWVVCHSSSLPEPLTVKVDPSHVVFISMEPPDWGRPEMFYNQFSHLITCDSGVRHPNVIHKNGVTWWAGLKVKFENGHQISDVFSHNYESFKAMKVPEKKNRISIITSSHKFFPGHKKRLRFLERLRDHRISEHIDFFGGGFNPIEDKLDGLMGYKYHIALENSSIDDYWTEKFVDPLLAYSLPIYYGCKNISDYFPDGGFLEIDIEKFDHAVDVIQSALERDLWKEQFRAIEVARDKILDDYNIFHLIADLCNDKAKEIKTVTLYPQSYFLNVKKPLLRWALARFKRLVVA